MTTDAAHQWKTVVTQFNSLAPSFTAREPFPSIRRREMAPILSEIRARGSTQTPRVNTIPENDLRACDPTSCVTPTPDMSESPEFKPAVSKMAKAVIQTSFSERVNVKKAIALMNLPSKEIKSLFWDKDEIDKMNGEKWSCSAYILNVKRYLKQAVASDGVIGRTYKFGKLEGNGRLYVENCGIQSLQHRLRNFLCGEYYWDFDIKNCHPSILLHICDDFQISAPNLKEYVLNRQEVLSENGLTKRDILVAINRDKNKKKKDNDYYNMFIRELDSIKSKILAHESFMVLDVKTNNEENPKSSVINKFMLRFEGDITQRVIRHFGDTAEIPMFDGIMVRRGDGCEATHLRQVNDLFKDEFHGYIKFDTKSTASEVNLDCGLEEGIDDYEKVKTRFEEKHFQTMKPCAYWRQNKQPDGSVNYSQVGLNDFKVLCEEYKIIDFNAKGEICTPSIFNKWVADTKRRKYECIDFLPYGKDDACPAHVYNTFGGSRWAKLATMRQLTPMTLTS